MAITKEEIKDKFDMALARRTTIDLDKCNVNNVIQGIAVFNNKEGAYPFLFQLVRPEELDIVIDEAHRFGRDFNQFSAILFAQQYMSYEFKAKEQAETSPGSPDSVGDKKPTSS